MNKFESCYYQSLELEVATGYNHLRFNNYFSTSKIYSLNFDCVMDRSSSSFIYLEFF